jgi:hypothetical protein
MWITLPLPFFILGIIKYTLQFPIIFFYIITYRNLGYAYLEQQYHTIGPLVLNITFCHWHISLSSGDVIPVYMKMVCLYAMTTVHILLEKICNCLLVHFHPCPI